MSSSTQRLILIATVTLMILFVLGNFFLTHVDPTSSYSLNITNQPTLGNPQSKVELVVFIEPKCPDCKDFNDSIFPKIKKDYIDTNLIKYTAVPVSFIEGSMPAAEALLCTYYQDEKTPNSALFFTFLDYLYDHQPAEWTDENILLMAAKADPDINLDKIKKCMERHVYHTRIMQNTAEATRVTGGHLDTPVLFINGVKIEGNAPKTIFKALDQALNRSEPAK